MMRDINTLIQALTTPAVLAMLGGLARACRFGAKSWKQFTGGIIISGFTGVVVHLLLQELDVSDSFKAAIVATAGYSGGAIMDALVDKVLSGIRNLPVPGAEVPLQAAQPPVQQTGHLAGQEYAEPVYQQESPAPHEVAMPWQDDSGQLQGQPLGQPVPHVGSAPCKAQPQ